MGSNIEKLKRLFKNIMNNQPDDTMDNSMLSTITTSSMGPVPFTTATPTSTISMANTTAAGGYSVCSTINSAASVWTLPAGGVVGTGTSGITFSHPMRTNIATFTDSTGKAVVTINLDGTVTWHEDFSEDEAAAKLSNAFTISAEMQAGISKSVKLKMRDSVFDDLIKIAKQKGPLTAEDLTYLLEASKIVEKLKGGKE